MTFSVFPNRSHFLSFNSESPPTLKKPVFARTSSNAQTPSSAGSLLVNDYKPFPGLSSLSLSLSLSLSHTHTVQLYFFLALAFVVSSVFW
jgi:hypothetical protein